MDYMQLVAYIYENFKLIRFGSKEIYFLIPREINKAKTAKTAKLHYHRRNF